MKEYKNFLNTNDKKEKLRYRTIFQRIEIMSKRIYHNMKFFIIKIICLMILATGLITFNYNLDRINFLHEMNQHFQFTLPNSLFGITLNLLYAVIYVFSIAIFVAIAKLILRPIKYDEYNKNVETIFTPTTREEIKTIIAPECIVSYSNPLDQETTIIEFFANSTKLEDWENKRQVIENYFGFYVKGIKRKGKDKILLYLTKENPACPKPIYWDNKYLNKDKNNFIIVTGKNCFGELATINLTTNPMYKIGAGSRGGKTTLQKLINYQCIQKGAILYIIDTKGVDYKDYWKKHAKVINDIDRFYSVVDGIYDVMQSRNEILGKTKFKNIDEYNKGKTGVLKIWKRTVLVIEEAADVLLEPDSIKLLSKEEKTRYYEMLDKLCEIARKGASAGCHIFLNTQRPSASIIPSQMNSNFSGGCIAGRSDKILSNIILGNDDADRLIPKESQGIFVNDRRRNFSKFLA